MPLFGKKIFAAAKPLSNKQPNETVYTVVHTKEQFKTKQEYEKRLSMYKERIWTCRCTGHVNLTHEEAWNSEKHVIKALRQQFLPCFEKPVLQLVHHSTIPLETLVDQAWLKLQQVLCVGEKVILKVKAAGRVIKGTIIKVDTAGLEVNPTSNCSSASSDKENSEEEGNSPKKWVPPKLLPYKYSFRLEGEDKIINAVPASDLQRVEKPPAKELLRLFIRTHSIRAGQNSTSPWVVDEDKVKEHNLPSKFADFLLSPVKIAEVAKKAEEEKAKKRKSKSSHDSSSAKKAKIDKSEKGKDNKKQMTLTGSPLKKKSSSSIKSKTHSPKKDSPKKKLQNGTIEISSSDSDDEDQPLAKLKSDSEDKSSSKVFGKLSGKSSLKKKDKKKSKDKKHKDSKHKDKKKDKHKDKKDKEKSKSKKSTADSDDEQPLAKLKKSPSKKSMKQMTLFELSKKKSLMTPEKKKSLSGMKTPEKITKLNSPPKTPAIVSKLVKAFKQDDQPKVKALAFQAAKMLTSPQRKRLPKDVKELVNKRFDMLEERKKLASMSVAEKVEYMKKKKSEAKKKLQEKQKELRKKYEDQDLELKPLPQPKLVSTPEGLPNELFGDIAMVTEFVSCYNGLLMPEDDYPIYTDALMKAICSGKEGFTYLGRVLVILLQTLLQDQISEDYQEMKVPLSDIPVNPYTASELVRLCLRGQDVEDQGDDTSDVNDEGEVSDDIIQQLENQELFQLDPHQKVQILKGLCLRIMGTYSVQDYMEEKQQESSELWKRKIKELKEKNDKLKKVKQLKKEEAEKSKGKEEEPKPEEEKNVLITHFYGKSTPDQGSDSSKPATPTPQSAEEPDSDDLASIVRRRRVMAAKAAAEKEKKDKEDKIRREKEFEELKKLKEKELFEKNFTEGIALAKAVLRLTPIGTDRHHNRYWVFSNTTPGLYIERGWVGPDIEYCPGDKTTNKEDSDSSFDDDESEDQESTTDGPPEQAKVKEIEKTAPTQGQNLWFTYDTAKDLDGLIENLHSQGIREGNLKVELKKRYSDVNKAINKANRTNMELRDSDGDKEILETMKKQTNLDGFDHHLKKEVLETELRLRNGGLGGVEDFHAWEAKLETSMEISSIAKCMLETQECVVEKFRQGIMGQKQKKVVVKEEDNNDDEEEKEEEIKIPLGITKWREGVENCTTLSRLHVLLGILDASIKWEKSAENAKCKICRKKGDDSTLLLCDECNQAFHMQCLRPALYYVPKGDWLCPACAPHDSRRRTRDLPKSYFSGSDESEDDDEKESNCRECGGDEGLIFCAECPGAYHTECHDPPLRHPPRGRWVCNDCKNGVRRKTRSKRKAPVSRRGGRKRKRYVEESSGEEEEEESEDADDQGSDVEEEEDAEEPTAKSQRQSHQHTTARRGRAAVGRPPASSRGQEDSKKGRGSTGQDRSRSSDIYADTKPSSRRAPSDLSICEQIVANTMRNKSCWPFLQPVDKKQVPDYYQIIKHPLDFQIIKDRLQCLVYGSVQEVLEDVKLVFNNAEIYNKEGSEILECMIETEKYFSAEMMKHLPAFPYSRGPVTNGHGDSDGSPNAGRKRSSR